MALVLMSSFQKKDVWLPTNLIPEPVDLCPTQADFGTCRPPCWHGPLLVIPAFLPCCPSPGPWPLACHFALTP